jgi:hypothetical protein
MEYQNKSVPYFEELWEFIEMVEITLVTSIKVERTTTVFELA